MSKLSVVIMNWARPLNVRRFVEGYLDHPRVGEVIVWDSSPLTPAYGDPLEDHGGRLKYVHASADLGLYPRFLMGAACFEDAVLIVDDDIELPGDTVTALHEAHLRDPAIVHGIFGRQPAADGSYTASTVHGPCQVVLTRALVASPTLCARAAVWGVRQVRELPGIPRGNGEDLVLSHVAMRSSCRLNHAWSLPYQNHGYDDANAISVRVKGHGSHRTEVIRWCRRNIMTGPPPAALTT